MINDENGFHARLERIDVLTAELGALSDSGTREKIFELLGSVMEFHRTALERVSEIVAESEESGRDLIETLSKDQLVSSLLLLYGLHPVPVGTRVADALERVRPYLKSHGGDAELVGIADGTVQLKMIGSCNGCPSSSETLKNALETAVFEAAPDIAGIELVSPHTDDGSTQDLVQISRESPPRAAASPARAAL